MRRVSLAFLVLLASLTPASAQWREYVYAPQGFAIQFPSLIRSASPEREREGKTA